MPVLRVMKNGEHLCTVGSNDVWMFSPSMWGEIWGAEVSLLNISGGSKRRSDGGSDFLIWEMPHELSNLDRITFFFEEGMESSPKGKIFDPESSLPEPPKVEMSFPPTDEDVTKLESRPAINSKLVWSFSINGDPNIIIAPDTLRQHVCLFLLWNEETPHQLRVSLSRKSLREITGRSEGEKIFFEYVSIGSIIEIAVGTSIVPNS